MNIEILTHSQKPMTFRPLNSILALVLLAGCAPTAPDAPTKAEIQTMVNRAAIEAIKQKTASDAAIVAATTRPDEHPLVASAIVAVRVRSVLELMEIVGFIALALGLTGFIAKVILTSVDPLEAAIVGYVRDGGVCLGGGCLGVSLMGLFLSSFQFWIGLGMVAASIAYVIVLQVRKINAIHTVASATNVGAAAPASAMAAGVPAVSA